MRGRSLFLCAPCLALVMQYALGFSLSMSSDGAFHLASAPGVFFSSDYAKTWKNILPNIRSAGVCISPNGQYQTIVDGASSGHIYTSSNFGSTFQQVQDGPRESWIAVSLSFDGSTQVAISEHFIYLSKDQGSSWKQVQSESLKSFRSIAVAGSGQYQTAIARGLLPIWTTYISSNFGDSWTKGDEIKGLPALFGEALHVGSYGEMQYLMTSTSSSTRLQLSSNFGESWDDYARFPQASTSFSSSGDAQYQAVTGKNGTMYLSYDHGSSWSPASIPPYAWQAVCTSSSGQLLTAVCSNCSSAIYYSWDLGYSWQPSSLPDGTSL